MDDRELLGRLRTARSDARLSQRELARRLGMSQGHLSKLLSEKLHLATKARRAISQFVEASAGADDQGWSRRVAEAAVRSATFRTIVDAALRLMHSDAKRAD